MTAFGRTARRLTLPGLLLCLASALSGCTWQGYAVSRAIRSVTGSQTRVHVIVPVTSPLRTYRVIETHWLENLLPGRMPAELERYLNDALADQLHLLSSSPTVVRRDRDISSDQVLAPVTTDVPTLVVGGFIDDYDPGYVGLRLADVGFNHVAVTVRIQLLDKQSGQIVGAASITTQDDRVTAASRGAILRLAQRVRAFVGAGYAR